MGRWRLSPQQDQHLASATARLVPKRPQKVDTQHPRRIPRIKASAVSYTYPAPPRFNRYLI
jgi:hypothetical protein